MLSLLVFLPLSLSPGASSQWASKSILSNLSQMCWSSAPLPRDNSPRPLMALSAFPSLAPVASLPLFLPFYPHPTSLFFPEYWGMFLPQSFSTWSSSAWNVLLPEICIPCSITSLKSLLKCYFVSEAFLFILFKNHTLLSTLTLYSL